MSRRYNFIGSREGSQRAKGCLDCEKFRLETVDVSEQRWKAKGTS